MKRPWIVRFQLFALVALIVLVLVRVLSGPGRPEGLLVFSDVEPHELRHEAFVLDRPARLAIEAIGSFEYAESGFAGSGLAAYGWILRREDDRVVWQMLPSRVQQERGSLAHAYDTIRFEPGTYDVYFTSYGNSFEGWHDGSFLERITGGGRQWQNDARKWMLAVRSADGTLDQLVRVRGDEVAQARAKDKLIWTSEPVRNGRRVVHLFEVERPTLLNVYAVGEFDDQPRDYAWIEDATTGEQRWVMTKSNTKPAGGAGQNRQFEGEVRLGPGLYRAVFEADDHHAFEAWVANPPFNPHDWGLTLAASTPEAARAVRAFDPWNAREPVVSILRVPDEAKRAVEFVVNEPLPVMVASVSEMMGDERFDYGWLEDESGQEVWGMSSERARPAGGHEKNREELSFLTLDPGTYHLFYRTDDSHAYDDWNSDPPAHPERWGVALFPLSASVPESAVQVVKEVALEWKDSEEWDMPEHPEPPEPPELPEHAEHAVTIAGPGEMIVDQMQVGNEANIKVPFVLPDPARVHIRATGEITPRGRFDYAWIERKGSGEMAWEMKWDNTKPAGGDDRNRTFDAVVDLPPGEYVARFQSDLSHAYGDFGSRSPKDPYGWGISVRRLE